MNETDKVKNMLLVDGHGLAFRGFYALPETLSAKDGTPTNAVVGFVNMLLKCMDDMKPDAIAVFFDPKGPTKRHEMLAEYKDGRKPTPENFKIQLPIIMDVCRAIGVPVFVRDGVEADDYIVSTAIKAAQDDWCVTILSADKDLFQIINENIRVMRPGKGVSEFKTYDEAYFTDEFGFAPKLMADYLAIVGDSADNIKGISGIGEKGAKELVSTYGTLENIYDNIEEMPKGKKTKLEAGRNTAFNSRSLIVPLDTEPAVVEAIAVSPPDMNILSEMCLRLGLKKLLNRFLTAKNINSSSVAVATGSLTEIKESRDEDFRDVLPVEQVSFKEILLSNELAIAEAEEGQGEFVFADRKSRISYLNLSDCDNAALFETWSKNGILYVYSYRGLLARGLLFLLQIESIRDIEVAHYLLHPDRGGKSISKTIGRDLPNGSGLACMLFKLWDSFMPEIKNKKLDKIMNDIDLPLCKTLANLQINGLYADSVKLNTLFDELKTSIVSIECDIAQMAGESINLNSPKQVAALLFDRLKLPPIKKTATGFSTDVSVLEELAELPKPLCDIPKKLIEYREQSKIMSGFVEPFLKLSLEGDGLIHSTFDHLATGTGRLASYDPNVQNMPLFGSWALRFRDCFMPSQGNVFVAADYSQIELRVLAHLSCEEKLIEAFEENRDIHRETASWVFELSPEEITQEQRRFAKVVNFGLLYGMSAFGLANRLGVSRPQASSIVRRYFDALPSVKKYLTDSINTAKALGYTESIFGRVRPLNELSTIEGRGNNPIDRVAVNTPIQSAASDIAKIALMRFDDALSKKFKQAKIVLQIHDSIVCECRTEDADAVESMLISVMEGVEGLSVPLKAEPKRGISLSSV